MSEQFDLITEKNEMIFLIESVEKSEGRVLFLFQSVDIQENLQLGILSWGIIKKIFSSVFIENSKRIPSVFIGFGIQFKDVSLQLYPIDNNQEQLSVSAYFKKEKKYFQSEEYIENIFEILFKGV